MEVSGADGLCHVASATCTRGLAHVGGRACVRTAPRQGLHVNSLPPGQGVLMVPCSLACIVHLMVLSSPWSRRVAQGPCNRCDRDQVQDLRASGKPEKEEVSATEPGTVGLVSQSGLHGGHWSLRQDAALLGSPTRLSICPCCPWPRLSSDFRLSLCCSRLSASPSPALCRKLLSRSLQKSEVQGRGSDWLY